MSSRKGGRKQDGHEPTVDEGTGPVVVSNKPEKNGGKKPPRPSQCRNYAREAVAESMPDIVESFVSEAKKGSVPHFNLLTKFGGFDHRPAPPPSKRPGKSFARRLLDDMKQHEARLITANEKRIEAERGTDQ